MHSVDLLGAAASVAGRNELLAILSASLTERPTSDLLSALEAAQVPAGPINDLDAAFSTPQVTARGMLVSTRVLGVPVRLLANPVHFSRTPIDHDRPSPALGAHTAEVLRRRLDGSGMELNRLQQNACV